MNERIRELYLQVSKEQANGTEWAIGGLENAQRFAELIVNECVYIVNNLIDHREPASTYSQKIKEHFKVQ